VHPEALAWLEQHTERFRNQPIRVLELGARNVNGSPRTLPALDHCTSYIGVDLEPGHGVDLIGDAADIVLAHKFDLIICTEVLEHTPRWDEIIDNATRHLAAKGTLLLTAAMDPRPPHSAVDGGELRADEHYQNLNPNQLDTLLDKLGYGEYTIETHTDRGDLYGVGLKP
jgi:SAM-dependent methyltransferase